MTSLYRFASPYEKAISAVGALAAVVSGLVYPALAVIYGNSFQSLSGSGANDAGTVATAVYSFIAAGGVALVAGFVYTLCFETAGAAMSERLKRDWVAAIFSQDLAFFDSQPVAGMPSRIADACSTYRLSVGVKMGLGVQFTAMALGGLGVAMYSSWAATLVSLAVLPLLAASGYFLVRTNQNAKKVSVGDYAEAGGIAWTTLVNLKTVLSLNAVLHFVEMFENRLAAARECGNRRGVRAGIANGGLLGSFLLMYLVLTLWGSFLLYNNVRGSGCDPSGSTTAELCTPSAANVFTSLLGVAFAGQGAAQIATWLETVSNGVASVRIATDLIDSKEYRTIDADMKTSLSATSSSSSSSSPPPPSPPPPPPSEAFSPPPPIQQDPLPLSSSGSTIEFRDVTFSFPSRPDDSVLSNFSLIIPSGKSIALVSQSGGGKSTILQLLNRFYDPTSGIILIDDVPIKELDIHELRRKISMVSQEPTLFNISIRDNIAYGDVTTECTFEEVQAAARLSQADNFITTLPDGYETNCGEGGGSQMSGGQKQRIAIARALVSKPAILVLDEATSALDVVSELAVQEAIDSILLESTSGLQSCTSIIIAHRLSTIRHVDEIIVLDKGRVSERGDHDALLQQGGLYERLWRMQNSGQDGRTSPQQSGESSSKRSSTTDSSSSSNDGSNDGNGDGNGMSGSLTSLVTPSSFASDLVSSGLSFSSSTHIEFRNVSFRYVTRNAPVLTDFSLKVARGSTLALAGKSGCGKSSAISLLERFYQPDSGEIFVDGVDIKEWDIVKLRQTIGLVSQEPVLFEGSIADNVKLGSPNATMDEVREACRSANADSFIGSFAAGYDTQLGETTMLSGGQKQRIAIARALLRKPSILLLDEPTSALDAESEQQVQEAINELLRTTKLTAIIVSHRLSTIASAQSLAIVSDGRVVEQGAVRDLAASRDSRYFAILSTARQARRKGGEAAASIDDIGDGGEVGEVVKDGTEEEEEEKEEGEDSAAAAVEEARPSRLTSREIRSRLFKLIEPSDYKWIAVCLTGALLAGLVFPFWGWVFANMITLFFYPVSSCSNLDVPSGFATCDEYWNYSADSIATRSFQVSGYWAGLICATMVGNIFLLGAGVKVAEGVSERLRSQAFRKLVSLEPAYHDIHEVGATTSQLSSDVNAIKEFTLTPTTSLIMALASVLVGITLAFVFMWPIALIGCATVPIMAMATAANMAQHLGTGGGDTGTGAEATGSVLAEGLTNIRTVYALDLQSVFAEKVMAAGRKRMDCSKLAKRGLSTGSSVFIQQLVNALQFWAGGELLRNYPDSFTFNGFLTALFALLFSLFGLGGALQGLDGLDAAKAACSRVFTMLDETPEIDFQKEEEKKEEKGKERE